MKKFRKLLGILAALAALAVIIVTVVTLWLEHWHAAHHEIIVSLTGDELYPVQGII